VLTLATGCTGGSSVRIYNPGLRFIPFCCFTNPVSQNDVLQISVESGSFAPSLASWTASESIRCTKDGPDLRSKTCIAVCRVHSADASSVVTIQRGQISPLVRSPRAQRAGTQPANNQNGTGACIVEPASSFAKRVNVGPRWSGCLGIAFWTPLGFACANRADAVRRQRSTLQVIRAGFRAEESPESHRLTNQGKCVPSR
jgi:hypothetical protein